MKMTDKDFDKIRDFMLSSYGIDLSKKRVLVESRLKQPATKGGYESMEAYLVDVFKKQDMKQDMVTRLTTNFTFFMREDIHYDFLVNTALPEFLADTKTAFSLKVWSAGCSSGDEAYTAAIYLREFQIKNPKLANFTIIATDISDNALAAARKGVYTGESLNKLNPAYKKKYFTEIAPDQFKVNPELSSKVQFSQFNLMNPFPYNLTNFDIIFCRNVMIYFTPEIRKNLGKKYMQALKPGGYLFIGLSESLPAAQIGLTQVRPAIFRREKEAK